jgi:membrane-associated protease RseP (regulator of RpoE activity)
MKRRVWTRRAAWLGMLAAAVLVSAATANADGPDANRLSQRWRVLRPGPGMFVAAPEAQPFDFTMPGPMVARLVKPSDYWIGVNLAPQIPEALRAHVDLPEGQGLLVTDVMPESPAAKAGVKVHDILIAVGDKPLKGVEDLIDAVEEAKESPLAIEVLRAGKKVKIDVTPARRPEDIAGAPGPGVPPLGPGRRDAMKWLEELRRHVNDGGGLWIDRFRPGVIVPPGKPMPGDMAVAITKQGDQPAKITVKKGDKTWEVTEDELDKLPDDVRPHVERMLGRLPGVNLPGAEMFNLPDLDIEVLPPQAAPRQWRMPREPAADKTLEDLQRQVDELRKAIEQMQNRQRPKPKPRDQKPPAKQVPSERVL